MEAAMTERKSSRGSRMSDRSLLRNPLPPIAAAITVFLVVLVLLTARLATGHDPGLRPTASAPVNVVSGVHGRTVLRTTASGRQILTTEAAGAQPAGSSQAQAPLVTRTSAASRRDD
jgi:hypothetical protein